MKIKNGWEVIFLMFLRKRKCILEIIHSITHYEEQYVTNPEAKILLIITLMIYQAGCDYRHATVGTTYQMQNYLDGKNNKPRYLGPRCRRHKAFLNYFDNVIIPLALGPLVTVLNILINFPRT